jgi:hypothetical protein
MAFAVGMTFFPIKTMEGYKADTFQGSASTCFQFFLGIFGTQELLVAMISAAAARDQVPKAVQSVVNLCNALIWFFFTISDGSRAVFGTLPSAFPTEAIYGNCVLFTVLGLVSLAGWKDGGSVMPKWGDMKPQGRGANALTAGLLNLSFFAIGCAFFTEPFLEMFLPGVVETLPGAVSTKRNPVGPLDGPVPPIMLIIANAGKTMIAAILTTLAACSVGNEDTTYRLLRAYVFQTLFYLGTFARDGVLASATGWPDPMRTISFVQTFGVGFYMANTFTGIPITLDKPKASLK